MKITAETQKSLIDYVNETVKWDNRTIETLKAKFEQDWLSAFEWKSLDLFKLLYKQTKLQYLLSNIEEHPEQVEEYLVQKIKGITEETMKGKFMFTNTSVMHNISKTLQKECDCELVKLYETWLVFIRDKSIPVK
jgi:hypothetical protein